MNISDYLHWAQYIGVTMKMMCQLLQVIKGLKRICPSPNNLSNFYRWSELPWLVVPQQFQHTRNAKGWKMVVAAESITSTTLSTIGTRRCLKKMASIIEEACHLGSALLSLLPVGSKAWSPTQTGSGTAILQHQVLEMIWTTLNLPQKQTTEPHLALS